MKKLLGCLLFFLFVSSTFAIQRNLPWIKIITRQEWGANSKYLFSDFKIYKDIIKQNKDLDKRITEDPKKYWRNLKERTIEKDREKYMLSHWKNQIKLNKVVYNLNWKKLWWPLWYKFHKTDIIIHHTAADYKRFKTKQAIEKYIRWVYYYHAIIRKWWDIWYNFLIDQFWNIYEWRQGWAWVVGANSSYNNPPSIWIALIWNFNIEKPTKKQLASLIKLSTALARKYNINPYNKVVYHKESFQKPPYIQNVTHFSIVWHRDTGHTDCPGKYLYADLPYIRRQVYLRLKNYKSRIENPRIKNISFVKQNKTIYIWKKFSLTNKIVIKLKNVKDLQKCDSNIVWLEITCKWNTITLQRRWYFVFWNKWITASSSKYNYKIQVYPIFMDNIRYLMKQKALKYLWWKVNTHKIIKIKHKIYFNQISTLIKKPVKVLLYELSKLKYYNIECTNNCTIITSKWIFKNLKSFEVDKFSNLIVWFKNKSITTSSLTILSNDWTIVFKNYHRKSYAWIPWNSFKWNIAIKKGLIKGMWWKYERKFIVINMLKINDYLAWIAESDDQMPFEKIKVMALLAKTYLLFYLDKWNIQPSIPKQAVYNAIDDPRIFQKYVGAGYEKTSKLWSKALKATKNQYLLYDDYIPILPYFSCSPGFTLSAAQKFGWVDTPYLVNNIDLWKCNKFYWHGVGLSWKWAEYLARKWLNYKQIIQWYFPGVVIKNFGL